MVDTLTEVLRDMESSKYCSKYERFEHPGEMPKGVSKVYSTGVWSVDVKFKDPVDFESLKKVAQRNGFATSADFIGQDANQDSSNPTNLYVLSRLSSFSYNLSKKGERGYFLFPLTEVNRRWPDIATARVMMFWPGIKRSIDKESVKMLEEYRKENY